MTPLRPALFIWCVVGFALVHAQSPDLTRRIDSLRYLSTDERILAIKDIMAHVRDNIPARETTPFVDQLEVVATELNDHHAISYFLVHKSIWLNVIMYRKAEAITMLLRALQYAQDHDCKNEIADALIELAIQHSDLGFKEKALSYFLQTVDFLKANDFKLKNTAEYLVHIGDFYYRMGYYEKAAEFFTLYTTNTNTVLTGWHMGNCLNTGGLTFQKIKQYDKALHYFQQSYDITVQRRDTTWIGLLKGNIGSVYFEMGELDKALPLLEESVRLGIKTRLYHSAAYSSQVLAKLALKRGNAKQALHYYNGALEINRNETDKGPALRTEVLIREGLSDFYRKNGDTDKALLHYERFTILRDSIAKLDRVEEMKKQEMKHEFQKQEQERLQQIELLKAEKALLRNKQLATIVIGGLVLLVAGLAFYINAERLKRKKETLQRELDFNKRELQLLVERLVQKTHTVEELQAQLSHTDEQPGTRNEEKTQLLTQLIESTILTEEDWNDFRKIFEQVHQGFFARLRQNYPTLTDGEIRLMALVKLNLSSKEIGNMLGISADSVNKSRYRLRKKLDLAQEVSLEEFIAKV